MALLHYLHLYSQEHVMCPAHVKCQKFQYLSSQLDVSLRITGYLCMMKTIL